MHTTLATGAGKRAKRGTVKLVLRPTARGAAALAKLAGKKVTVRVKVAERGKKVRTVVKKVKVG